MIQPETPSFNPGMYQAGNTCDTKKDMLYNLQGGEKIPLGYEQISLTNTVQTLPSIPTDAMFAIVVIESDPTSTAKVKARFREDATAPTTSTGMPLVELGIYQVVKSNLENFKLIGTEAGKNHTVNIQYYK